jgi:hypothetical protein
MLHRFLYHVSKSVIRNESGLIHAIFSLSSIEEKLFTSVNKLLLAPQFLCQHIMLLVCSIQKRFASSFLVCIVSNLAKIVFYVGCFFIW